MQGLAALGPLAPIKCLLWKLFNLMLLQFGTWTSDSITASGIIDVSLWLPRLRAPTHHALMMNAGAVTSAVWSFLPAGFLIAKTGQALNASPTFISTASLTDANGRRLELTQCPGRQRLATMINHIKLFCMLLMVYHETTVVPCFVTYLVCSWTWSWCEVCRL